VKNLGLYLSLLVLIGLVGCVATWGSSYHIDSEDGSRVFIRYDSILISIAEIDHHAEEICARYHKVAVPQSRSDASIIPGGSLMRASYACVPSGENSAGVTPASTEYAKELVFWNSIKDSKNPDDFREYLKRFPDGLFSGLARNWLATTR
jgi:hypothetical protein